jgi:hypothetical protein
MFHSPDQKYEMQKMGSTEIESNSILLYLNKNIRPTHRKITNKPWDDRNYIDSNRKMYKNI